MTSFLYCCSCFRLSLRYTRHFLWHWENDKQECVMIMKIAYIRKIDKMWQLALKRLFFYHLKSLIYKSNLKIAQTFQKKSPIELFQTPSLVVDWHKKKNFHVEKCEWKCKIIKNDRLEEWRSSWLVINGHEIPFLLLFR